MNHILSIRETLFGDLPLSEWPGGDDLRHEEPWKWFINAREALERQDRGGAIETWKRIIAQPGLESRHYAQAWQFLRMLGVEPTPAESKQLLGVVLEVPVEMGLDLLAAYPERNARYHNYSGAGVLWEHPSDALDAEIDALLQAGQQVLDAIGPWRQARPAPPPPGQVRINLLSPAGLHFGQAQFAVLASDRLGKPVIDAGVVLMQKMIAMDPQRHMARE